MSVAYDTMNHILLIQKRNPTTPHNTAHFVELSRTCFPKKIIRVTMQRTQQMEKWRKKQNGLLHGSLLTPILFNILYTNDQSINNETRISSFTPMLYVSRPSTSHSSKLEKTTKESLPWQRTQRLWVLP